MVVRFSDTEKISVAEGTIWDYPLPTEDIGIAYQKLHGRGPQQGLYLNKVCHEIYFIISGSATFYIKNEKYEVKARDAVIVEPNTKHYFEADNLEYITITRPNWYEEQYEQAKE